MISSLNSIKYDFFAQIHFSVLSRNSLHTGQYKIPLIKCLFLSSLAVISLASLFIIGLLIISFFIFLPKNADQPGCWRGEHVQIIKWNKWIISNALTHTLKHRIRRSCLSLQAAPAPTNERNFICFGQKILISFNTKICISLIKILIVYIFYFISPFHHFIILLSWS